MYSLYMFSRLRTRWPCIFSSIADAMTASRRGRRPAPIRRPPASGAGQARRGTGEAHGPLQPIARDGRLAGLGEDHEKTPTRQDCQASKAQAPPHRVRPPPPPPPRPAGPAHRPRASGHMGRRRTQDGDEGEYEVYVAEGLLQHLRVPHLPPPPPPRLNRLSPPRHHPPLTISYHPPPPPPPPPPARPSRAPSRFGWEGAKAPLRPPS